MRFFQRHAWSLPWLDASLAIFRRDSPLRQRVLLMAAILEASPQHAEFFLRPPPSRPSLLCGLAIRAVTSALKIACGMLLLPFVSRAHEDAG
jgi:hypothetical protein